MKYAIGAVCGVTIFIIMAVVFADDSAQKELVAINRYYVLSIKRQTAIMEAQKDYISYFFSLMCAESKGLSEEACKKLITEIESKYKRLSEEPTELEKQWEIKEEESKAKGDST